MSVSAEAIRLKESAARLKDVSTGLEKKGRSLDEKMRDLEEKGRRLKEKAKELEARATKWEDKCKGQAAQIDKLTTEFGKSRAEVIELKKRLKEVEAKCSTAERLLEEKTATCGTSDEAGMPVQNAKKKVEDPLLIFPEEIWAMIFGYLKEPLDLKSCYETCTTFMCMLQDRRTTFLFKEVLEIIQNLGGGSELPWRLREWKPRWSEIMECRRVSYGWKQSVDNFLQETCPLEHPTNENDRNSTAIRFTVNDSPWDRSAALRNLSGDINPMASRFLVYSEELYLDDSDDEEVENTWPGYQRRSEVAEFLREFGQHVWYFKAIFDPEYCFHSYWWTIEFPDWLELMPNLKALHLCVGNGDDYVAEGYRNNWEYSFPTLPSLNYLQLENYPNFSLASTLAANPQIEKLHIINSWLPDDMGSLQFDMLKELSFENGGSSFPLLACVNPGLRKLSLYWPGLKWGVSGPGWNELFRRLEKFAGTLVELKLKLQGPNMEPSVRLNLPHVRVLDLEINCFYSVDFILPLVNLESLKVKLVSRMGRHADNNHFGEIVQIREFIHDLKKSNIWRLFPKLRKAEGYRQEIMIL